MTPTDLFRLYIVVEKSITLVVPDRYQLDKLLAQLRVAKSRHSQSMRELGMSSVDNLADKAIRYIISDTYKGDGLEVTISVEPVRRSLTEFKLLTIEIPQL